MYDVNCAAAAAAAAYIATCMSGGWVGAAVWLNWRRVSMGVLERMSSERSLMLGRHLRMIARSAAEILPPTVGCEDGPVGGCRWEGCSCVPLDHAPGLGICCWVGMC